MTSISNFVQYANHSQPLESERVIVGISIFILRNHVITFKKFVPSKPLRMISFYNEKCYSNHSGNLSYSNQGSIITCGLESVAIVQKLSRFGKTRSRTRNLMIIICQTFPIYSNTLLCLRLH